MTTHRVATDDNQRCKMINCTVNGCAEPVKTKGKMGRRAFVARDIGIDCGSKRELNKQPGKHLGTHQTNLELKAD